MQDHKTIKEKYQKIFARAGKPRLYQSPEDLETAIHEYFTECDENQEPPTLTGLKMSLGFSHNDRNATNLLNYAKYGKEYADILEQADGVLTSYYEKHLMGKNFQGARFWLNVKKSWIMTEKQEITSTTVSKEDIEKEIQNLNKV